MVEVVVDVQIWVVDVKNKVVVMNLRDPVAIYSWLKHVSYEAVFVVMEVLEVQALWSASFGSSSYNSMKDGSSSLLDDEEEEGEGGVALFSFLFDSFPWNV
ncbi:hypothetical protein Tco_1015843 [Tanacetum coccineum]|uniref:Uncharacterized protein n=1 Tax=Tanacetum coccineum TaxID=301880 RepID=A0ABQ5FLY3_9ASTR